MDPQFKPRGNPKAIFRAGTQLEAQSFVVFLGGRGIPAVVQGEYLGTMMFTANSYAMSPEVMVGEEDVEKARHLVEEFERVTRHADPQEPDAKDQFDEPHVPWKDWPRCPECQCLRIAECPDCGEAGSDFSLSEYQEEDDPSLEPVLHKPSEDGDDREDGPPPVPSKRRYPLLDCAQCGEVFRPVFYRACAHCQHVFEDGKNPPRVEPKEKFRWTPILALIGLVGAIIAVTYALYMRGQMLRE